MDASDDHSAIMDESQPSQLIRNVLQGGFSVANDANRSLGEYNTSKDASLESPIGRNSNSAPRYQYHGLAATQSQSQHCDAYEDNQGSQKENIGTPNTSGEVKQHHVPMAIPRQASPHMSSSLGPDVKEPSPSGGQSSHLPLPSTAKSRAMAPPTLPLSLQSSRAISPTPHLKTTAPKAKPPLPRSFAPPATNRQPVEENWSQDSFAGPVPQDLERQFLATSRNFEIPLDELGRISYNQKSSDTPPLASNPPSSEDPEMFAFPPSGIQKPFSAADQGRVLVAPSPSNSQSQTPELSQQSPGPGMSNNRQPMTYDEDMVNVAEDALSEVSTPESYSQPSSSYERYVAGELEPIEQIHNSETLVATQPSTQPYDSENDVLVDGQNVLTGQTAEWGTGSHGNIPSTSTVQRQGQGSSVNPPAASDNSSVDPPSILSLVDPRKTWRFSRYRNKVQPSTVPPPPLVEEPQHTTTETQPSFDDDDDQGGGMYKAGFHLQPRQELTSPSPPNQLPTNDNIDIVPDSEPPRIEQDSRPLINSSSGSNTLFSTVPSGSSSRLHASQNTESTDSVDFVPDSVIDDDDDVPLANLAVKKSPVKVPPRSKTKATTATAGTRRPLEMVASSPLGKKRNVTKDSAQLKQDDQQDKILRSKSPLHTADTGPERRQGTPETPDEVAARYENNLVPPDNSMDTSVVPSSIPEQDLHGNTPVPKPSVQTKTLKKGQKGKAKTPLKPAKAVQSTSKRKKGTRSTSAKRRRIASGSDSEPDDGDSESSYGKSETEVILKPKREEEEETELAYEDNSEADDDYSEVRPSSGKRKRSDTKSGNSTKQLSKRSTRTSKRTDRANSSIKRLPSALAGPGTKVFALWKPDNHYYSGYVHSHMSGTKYRIKFHDGSEEVVDILQLRFNGLRVGDNVILTGDGRKAKVVDVDSLEDEEAVLVEFHDGEESVREKISLGGIMVAVRTISGQWQGRIPTEASIEPRYQTRSPKRTPSLSKQSVLSGGSGKLPRSKILSNFGFAVTLSPGQEDWEARKDKVITTIRRHGGTVIDDWFSVIRMNGKYSHGNKLWTMRGDQVKWLGSENLERVFLLADDASQKPKYLVALALGIPCLSTDWVEEFVKNSSGNVDWQPFLLPKGCSTVLEARVSQFVDLDWCNSPEHLSKIMDNKVPPKVFKGKKILCLSPDFIPGKSGKNGAEVDRSKEAWSAVPRVVVAMGATLVEATADVKHATKKPSEYDYVVLKDSSEFKRYLPDLREVNYASFQWVKECLIAGKLVPCRDLDG